MGMGESSANSIGMVGAAHPTPRPARVKAIDAAEERNMRAYSSWGNLIIQSYRRKEMKKYSQKERTRDREKQRYEHKGNMKQRAKTNNEELKMVHLNWNRTIP
jgi:hypothetical protein